MSKPDHSPLPWDVRRALKPVDGEYDCAITSSDGPHAECFGRTSETCRPNAEANAQFIVTACNSYYDNKAAIAELVEALEWISSLQYRDRTTVTPDNAFEAFEQQNKMVVAVFKKADELIAKHKADKP